MMSAIKRTDRIFKILFLITVFICSAIKSRAQGIYENIQHSTVVPLYRLDEVRAKFLMNNPDKVDSAWLYNNKIAEMRYDTLMKLGHGSYLIGKGYKYYSAHINSAYYLKHVWKIWDNGYYLVPVVVGENLVQYKLLSNPKFQISTYKIGAENFVFVTDSAGVVISDANVKLDTMVCFFDAGVGGYKIRNKDLTGIVNVERGSDFVLNRLYAGTQPKGGAKPPRDRYKYNKPFTNGYFVTNKPRYKHWDTVFWKAYIVNKRGKPFRKNLLLIRGQGTTVRYTAIEPKEPGVFHGWFLADDSFSSGNNNLWLMYKSRTVKRESLQIDDYETDDVSMNVTTMNTASPGVPAKVFVSLNNKAGLPIMDGKLEINLHLRYLTYADADSISFPLSWYNSKWKQTLTPDPSGITELTFADSMFIQGPGTWQVSVQYTTDDNRRYNGSADVHFSTSRDRLSAAVNRDTLSVVSWYSGKPDKRTFKLRYYSRNDFIAVKNITTPYVQKLEPWVHRLEIYSGDTLKQALYNDVALPEINGKRTGDSVFISFRSFPGRTIYYKIFQNNKLMLSGNGDSLSFKQADASKHSWHIQYGRLENTNPMFYSKSFHLAEKMLNVKVNTLKTVYPGQHVPVDIEVTDMYGKPVKKVNLTAWAVNAQMPGVTKPEIPYLGLVKFQKPMLKQQLYLSEITCLSQTPIRGWQVTAFKLRENRFFELLYPPGVTVFTDTSVNKTTEVDVFVTEQGAAANLQYVLANDTLVFLATGNSSKTPWKMLPGKYKMEVRTWNRKIRLGEIEITKGKKNFIGVNVDSMVLMGKTDTARTGILSKSEKELVQGHLLQFMFQAELYYYDTLLVLVNGKLRHASLSLQSFRQNQHYTRQFIPGYNNYRTGVAFSFYGFGPVEPGDKIELAWKNHYSHAFTYEPGLIYSMTRTDLIRFPMDSTFRGNEYFSQFGLSRGDIFAHWFDPYYKPIIPQMKPEYRPPAPAKQELPVYRYKDYYPHKQKPDGKLRFFVKGEARSLDKFWLFNMADSSLSVLNSHFYGSRSEIQGTGLYPLDMQSFYHTKVTLNNPYLLVLRSSDTAWLVKRLVLDTAKEFLMVLKSEKFRKLKESEFLWLDRMAKILGKAPMAVFRDTPTIDEKPTLTTYAHKQGRTALECTVAGPGQQYVVDHAFVILEKDGYFVRGAITNEDGVFRMDSLKPGRYMLKIKGQNYHYWITYNLILEKGKLHIARLVLKPFPEFNYSVMDYASETADYDGEEVGDLAEGRGRSIDRLVSVNASVAKSAAGISIRGIRGYSNATYIDGMRIKGKLDKLESDKDERNPFQGFRRVSADTIEMETMVDKMVNDPSARRTRRIFRDYAYWIPNLNTDKKGRAGFSITYPDNITQWQTWVPAMDGKRHSGLGTLEVNAFKPISMNLALPGFLTEGDELLVNGKVLNYTGKQLEGKYYIQSGTRRKELNIKISNLYKDSMLITAGKPGDSLKVEGGFEMTSGYRDAEQRNIQVNAATVISGRSKVYKLDSISDPLTLRADDSGLIDMKVAIYDHQLGLLNTYIEELESLAHLSNQYQADYLLALVSAKNAYASMGWGFDKEKELKEALRLLKNAQNKNGSFGWYGSGKNENLDFTIYAADVLYAAHKGGYENNAWLNTSRYLSAKLPNLYGDDLVAAMKQIKRMGREVAYDSLLKRVNYKKLSVGGKLDYQLLMQMMGKKTDLSIINQNLVSVYNGAACLGVEDIWAYNVHHDRFSTTAKAYNLMMSRKDSLNAEQKEIVSAIRTFLIEPENRNCHNLALACAAVAGEFDRKPLNRKERKGVTVNGTAIDPMKYPYMARYMPGESVEINNSGTEVYIIESRKVRT